jgi:hypothetical protein
MNNYRNLLDRHHKYLRYLLVLSFITFLILVAATSAQGANCLSVDGVSSGKTVADTDSSITISHTTGSGSDRLMLVGISYNNDFLETVTSVTYNSPTPLALEKVGEIANADDAMVYIYASISPSDGSVVSPDPGTYDVVINFSTNLTQGAIAGVMTFTSVHQTTPLGTFASNQGDDSTPASVNISSAPGELVYGVASAEYDALTTASSGQYERWKDSLSGESTNGAGGTDGGASTVSMTWDLNVAATPSNHWAIGGVSIKPASAGAKNLVMVVGTDDSQPYDSAKQALFESWGWTVAILDSVSAGQATYDNAALNNDVMYISESVSSGNVNTMANDLDIGIVVDEHWVWDDMNFFTNGNTGGSWGSSIYITDNNHYITSPFSTGSLTAYTQDANLADLPYTLATEGQLLATFGATAGGDPTLFAFETGDALYSGTATNRRVGFPSFDSNPSIWTTDFDTLLERSLDWAAGCAGAGGGPTNNDPVLNSIGPKSVEEGQLLEFTISATDPDTGDTLTYSASSLPTGATFNPGTQTFSWTPNVGDAGTYPNVRFTVDDNGTPQGSDFEDITITVTAAGGGGAGTPITAGDVAGYSCSMKITIDNTKVAFTSSEHFPVLISLTDDSLKTSGCGFVTDPDGDDIVFTNATTTLQLYHEIEKYDAATGELVAWVLVPSLSGTADTDIYMYFGDSNVTSPTESPTDVWDSNYVGVWHLDDTSGDTNLREYRRGCVRYGNTGSNRQD